MKEQDPVADPAQTSTVLLEVGTEEIPARFLPPALVEIREIGKTVFDEFRIPFESIASFATPRRITVIFNGVAQVQHDNIREVFGPARNAAFDGEGKPSKAAIGFARSVGVDVSELTVRQRGKGEYVVAVVEEKGIAVATVLREALPKIVLSLRFPKSMRWGDTALQFVRPIQWILAMLDTEGIPFAIDGIRSGTMTRGHRFLSPAAFRIRDIASYPRLLENSFVILDHERRRAAIREGIASLLKGSGMQAVEDEELVETVNYLVEYPTPVRCSFSPDYLSLPRELLVTVMKDHQKYFAVQDAGGNLVNQFIVISNTKPDNDEIVRIGAERVIKARFDDARFYFHEDRKRSLVERVADLKAVTYHDRLGTLHEKVERVVTNAAFLAERIAPGLKDTAVRAALLSKSDLISGVVREFPELQGIMGKYYALHDGESADVAAAMEEQYLPKHAGDRVPGSDVGAIVSIADKIDTLASFFAIGMTPTGSEDPFALRRQAMGIVSILMERKYPVSFSDIAGHALAVSGRAKDGENVSASIRGFMEQRIEFVLSGMGYEQDLIRSVLSLSCDHPFSQVIHRLDALREFREDPAYPDFLLGIKRVNNITPKTPLPPSDAGLFTEGEEKDLSRTYREVRDVFLASLDIRDYAGALRSLKVLTAPINRFFDSVLVMHKDEGIKANRLALLREIWSMASLVADFSKLI